MSLFLICFRRSSRKSADGRRQEFNVQHRCRTRWPDKTGVVCVRVLRVMSLSATRVSDGQLAAKARNWEELIDDVVV